jgi:hypothetical protein
MFTMGSPALAMNVNKPIFWAGSRTGERTLRVGQRRGCAVPNPAHFREPLADGAGFKCGIPEQCVRTSPSG